MEWKSGGEKGEGGGPWNILTFRAAGRTGGEKTNHFDQWRHAHHHHHYVRSLHSRREEAEFGPGIGASSWTSKNGLEEGGRRGSLLLLPLLSLSFSHVRSLSGAKDGEKGEEEERNPYLLLFLLLPLLLKWYRRAISSPSLPHPSRIKKKSFFSPLPNK